MFEVPPEGSSVCNNNRSLPIAKTDAEILEIVIDETLSPTFLGQMVRGMHREEPLAGLWAERQTLAKRITNSENAIGATEDPATISSFVARVEEARRRLLTIDEELRTAQPPPPERELRSALQRRADEWRAILARAEKRRGVPPGDQGDPRHDRGC